MCWDMIGFSIYISCYNFPIIIAYFSCILKIYSSEDITWLPCRNWLARSAVNGKVGGSSPPWSYFLSTQHIHLHTFLHDHYFGSYGCLNTIDRRKANYYKIRAGRNIFSHLIYDNPRENNLPFEIPPSQDIIICTHGGCRTHNLWIRSPTRYPLRHAVICALTW